MSKFHLHHQFPVYPSTPCSQTARSAYILSSANTETSEPPNPTHFSALTPPTPVYPSLRIQHHQRIYNAPQHSSAARERNPKFLAANPPSTTTLLPLRYIAPRNQSPATPGPAGEKSTKKIHATWRSSPVCVQHAAAKTGSALMLPITRGTSGVNFPA